MPNDVPFPDCLIDTLAGRIKTIPGVTRVFKRELHPTDDNGSVGICLESWAPVESEVGGYGPTFSDYVIHIEHMVKDADREDGTRQHTRVARSIRSMLYRDQTTQVSLRELAHIDTDFRENLMKWSLEQRFASNEIKGMFYFVSGTTATFQTSTT